MFHRKPSSRNPACESYREEKGEIYGHAGYIPSLEGKIEKLTVQTFQYDKKSGKQIKKRVWEEKYLALSWNHYVNLSDLKKQFLENDNLKEIALLLNNNHIFTDENCYCILALIRGTPPISLDDMLSGLYKKFSQRLYDKRLKDEKIDITHSQLKFDTAIVSLLENQFDVRESKSALTQLRSENDSYLDHLCEELISLLNKEQSNIESNLLRTTELDVKYNVRDVIKYLRTLKTIHMSYQSQEGKMDVVTYFKALKSQHITIEEEKKCFEFFDHLKKNPTIYKNSSLTIAINKFEKTLNLRKILDDPTKRPNEKIGEFQLEIIKANYDIDQNYQLSMSDIFSKDEKKGGKGFAQRRDPSWDKYESYIRTATAVILTAITGGLAFPLIRWSLYKPTESEKMIKRSDDIIKKHKKSSK